MSKALAEILIKDRLITQAQLETALQGASSTGNDPVRFLIIQRQISENKLVDYLSKKYNIPSINLSKFEIQKNVIESVPTEVARDRRFIPIQLQKDTLVVAICDPTVMADFDKAKFVLKKNIEAVLTTYSAFEEAVAKYYGSSSMMQSALNVLKKDEKSSATGRGYAADKEKKEEAKDEFAGALDQFVVHEIDQETSQIETQGEAVVAFVNGILAGAIQKGASDIHVEAYEKRFRVRYRIDGTLHEVAEIPADMKRAVVARLKIMSRIDISETRIPQDGRIKLKLQGKEIDFRVNTLPTLFGEKVVLRLLSQGNLTLDLSKLGFAKKQLELFRKGIYSPNGMVLVTGPTGSGKTTTLYSALAELNLITDNISTAEDPVEYNLEGINQTQINKDVGLTFAAVLRALLRQDPDTILVGEIRDYETAEVSIQAALTGHLVLSTLHTNDAPSTITRLMNMGVEPFLVTSAVNTIVAQRLLRRVCQKCKAEVSYPTEKLREFGIDPKSASQLKFYQGKGCSNCGNSGFKGRVAVYEVLDFSTTLKEMVLKGATAIDIRKQAIIEGMATLREEAVARAMEGMTSLPEAIGMTSEG